MCLYSIHIHIYYTVVPEFVMKSLWSSDMQLKLFSFSTEILTGFHTILCVYCMFINFPFCPEMAKMMILSDCYQVNLMIDHNPARLNMGFINFTAISEYYLLSLGLFCLPELRTGDTGDHFPTQRVCDEIKLFSASSRILSITSHGDIATFAYNANFILVKQIYSSRSKIFLFGTLQIWHGVSLIS